VAWSEHNKFVASLNPSKALDYFFKIAVDITPYEKNLVKFCKSNLHLCQTQSCIDRSSDFQNAPFTYGIRPGTPSCPFLNIILPYICTDPLTLLWVIISAEAGMTAMRGVSTPPESLLRRKIIAYRVMNHRISDPELQYSEAVLCGLLAATVADSHVSGPNVGHLHLKGLMQLIHKRDGFKNLSNTLCWGSPMMYVWSHLVVDGAGGIANVHDLKSYTQEFLQTLLDIQSWNKRLREQLSKLGVNPELSKFGANPEVSTEDPEYRLRSYHLSRTQCFSTLSILRPLIDPDYSYSTFVEKAGHFLALFNLNLTLWMFREDCVMGASFLNRLLKNIDHIDPVTGSTPPKNNGLIFLITRARYDVDSINVEERQELESRISWMLIRALKLAALMNDQWRRKLVQMMFGWLFGKEGEQEMYEMSEDEIAEMIAEITRNWQAGD